MRGSMRPGRLPTLHWAISVNNSKQSFLADKPRELHSAQSCTVCLKLKSRGSIRNAKEMVNRATLPAESLLTDESQRFQVLMVQPVVAERVKWLLTQDAATHGDIELNLGAALGQISPSTR